MFQNGAVKWLFNTAAMVVGTLFLGEVVFGQWMAHDNEIFRQLVSAGSPHAQSFFEAVGVNAFGEFLAGVFGVELAQTTVTPENGILTFE